MRPTPMKKAYVVVTAPRHWAGISRGAQSGGRAAYLGRSDLGLVGRNDAAHATDTKARDGSPHREERNWESRAFR